MKSIFNTYFLLVTIFFCIYPSIIIPGQPTLEEADFESLYQKGLGGLNLNIMQSMECLKKLESRHNQLSPVQRAKANYLRLKVIYSDLSEVKALEKRLFAAPDSLGKYGAMVYLARKFLEKSMPDKAIPLLMEALDTLKKGSDTADYIIINLCEAYREKQEYSKGIDMLKDILFNKTAVSYENQTFAFNRMAANRLSAKALFSFETAILLNKISLSMSMPFEYSCFSL